MHWSKQIGLLLLLLVTACHRSSQVVPDTQNDNPICPMDSFSVSRTSDTLNRVSAFRCEGKHIFVVPSFWVADSLNAFCLENLLSGQASCHLLADTNTCMLHSQIPSLFINMEEMDRERIYQEKSQQAYAHITLFLPDGTNEYEGEIAIKTRGNSSWVGKTKKPFTIKLPKATRLLGLEKGKSFTLLNNKMDVSFIRNAVAFHLSREMGVFAPDCTYLSIYLNGEYLGIYQMTNKIEVGKRSVDIVDLEKENKRVNALPLNEYPTFSIGESGQSGHKKGMCIDNPDDITGGYRLDCNGSWDLYELTISGFVSQAGDPVRIKSPKHASQEQVEYIADFYGQMETAVMAPTGFNPETGKHYSEYLDMESFARYFLIQEITQNIDGGWCSFMMYKDAGDSSKMVAGPAWDFDRAMQKSDNLPTNQLWTCAKTSLLNHSYSGGLYYWLWQHEDFQDLVKHIYFEEVHGIINDSIQWETYTDSLASTIRFDVECTKMRFTNMEFDDYQEIVGDIKNLIKRRDAFLHWLWTTDSSEIVTVRIINFDPNGKGFKKDITLYGNKAEGVTLPKIEWVSTSYRDSILLGYFICGTDSSVKEGTTLYTNQRVEIRWKDPNWFEAQYRRLCKKFRKLFPKEVTETVMEPANSSIPVPRPR